MGFLDQLKEIGFGNRGPYGRMTSGATNFAQYMQQRNMVESERGVSQALAMAAKEGKPIPFNVQVEIAEKWNVPLNEVIQRVKGINEDIEKTTMKQQLHTLATMYFKKKKENPNWKPTEDEILAAADEVGVDDMRVMGMLKDAIIQLRGQSRTFPHDPTKALLSVNELNEVTTLKEAVPETEEKETWEQLSEKNYGDKVVLEQRNKKTGEIKRTVVDKSTGGGEGDKRYKWEQQILSIAKQLSSAKIGENLVDAALTSETRTQAMKDLQKQLNTMVKEFEDVYGKGSARKIGQNQEETVVGKELTKEKIDEYIKAAKGDVNKAKELARKDGYDVP